jgi:hypothetical protein
MKDRAGNELKPGDRVLYLQSGTSTSWLVWGVVDSFTNKKIRVRNEGDSSLVLREPRAVVLPFSKPL